MAIKILTVLYLTLIIGVFSRNVRIIGGEYADIQEFPHLVSIRIPDLKRHVCTGAIISHYHIITAGHCLFKHDVFYSRLRMYTGTSFLSDYSGPAYSIDKLYVHPGYTGKFEGSNDNHNDIGVIRVKEFIEFNEFQNKIGLPSHDALEGTFVSIAGWGSIVQTKKEYTDRLMKVSVKIMKYSECKRQFAFPILLDQICTYNEGKGSGMGDSGGPVTANGEIVGIVSFSVPLLDDKPDVQNNVYAHKQFVQSILDETNWK